MARSAVVDPLDKFRWTVSIPGFSKLGFATSTTPEYDIQTKKYAEGGAHLTPRQIIDSIDYKPVVLTRGVTNDTSFNKWATGFIDLVTNNYGVKNTDTSLDFNDPFSQANAEALLGSVQDNGVSAVPSSQKQPKSFRRDVKIEHVNGVGQVEVAYFLYNAFVINYKPASDFDASSDDTVSIESITLGYDSFEVKYSGIAGTAANLLSTL